jgi:hypothetical protein
VTQSPSATPPAAPPPQYRRPQRSFGRRFGLSYAGLVLVLAALGLGGYFVWDASRDDGASGDTAAAVGGDGWSDFAPQRTGLLAAKEIARHVQTQYRLQSGREAVAVIAERPVYQETPILFMLLRPRTVRFDRDIDVLEMGDGMQYILCGLGPACSIAEGRPSPERARWLRRQAIELALYSFHYGGALEHVLVYMPPSITQDEQGQPQASSYALLFRRQDLGAELRQPLEATVPQRDRYIVTDPMSEDEAERLDAIAERGFYSYELQQGADGNPILILDPQEL